MNDADNFSPEASRPVAPDEVKAGRLSAALELGDFNAFLLVLRALAQEKGMARLAAEIGVNRESLYKTLSPGSQPRFETIAAVIRGLGLSIGIQPGKTTDASTGGLRGHAAGGMDSGFLYQLAERALKRSITPKLRVLRQEAALAFTQRKALALGRLTLALEHAGRTVPYYRDLFSRYNFTAEKLVADFRRFEELPCLTPVILREQGRRMLSESCSAPVERKLGGGKTLQNAFYHDQESLDWITANNLLTLEWGGKNREDREAYVTSGSSPHTRGPGFRPAFLKDLLLNRRNIHMPAPNPADMEKFLYDLRGAGAGTIQGPPSSVGALAAYLANTGSTGRGLFKVFFATGENLSASQRELIESVFCARVAIRYGAGEFGVLAQETEDGPAGTLMVADSMIWPEAAPSEKPGGRSELVFTSLRNSAMPLIRYRMGDKGELREDADGWKLTDLEYSPRNCPDFE